MQVKTWFGIFTVEGEKITDASLFKKDIDHIVKRIAEEPLLLRGNVAGIDLGDLAVGYGFVSSNEEYERLLHDIHIRLVKLQMSRTATQDRQIIAATEAIDDIDETVNSLGARLKEWYIQNFNETQVQGEELARRIAGMEVFDPQLKTMQSLASGILGLYSSRNVIENYLKETMAGKAPNLTGVAGYMLGSRLLSTAGSLEKLAAMPSSTIQVLGANNALFKHLKGKAPSPKHGLIFRHPLLNTAQKWQRGKIARALAAKISLAARYDCYSGELKKGLLEELTTKVEDIRKRYPKPRQKPRLTISRPAFHKG